MGYVYRDPSRAENQLTVAHESAPAPPSPTVPVHPKVKALLDGQKARICELESELTAAEENYDTLASVNQNLRVAAAQATDRAEKAEHDARLARAEADSPSAVKALEELLAAEKEKCKTISNQVTALKRQLKRAHQRNWDLRQKYEEAAGCGDGTVAVISATGVQLLGPYAKAAAEEVAKTFDRAFDLFVKEGLTAKINPER